jgi:hypothetical protein
LRVFYYAAALKRWVELPMSIDAAQQVVMVTDIDISAFSDHLTRIALCAPPAASL